MHTSVEIDLNALRFNYRQLKNYRTDGSECFAVIKKNAYGHGLLPCADALAKEGADGLAVSYVDEAIQLRQAGIKLPIMVMSEILDADTVATGADLGLDLVIGDAQSVSAFAGKSLPRVWVEINTGMNRYGIAPDELGLVLDTLKNDSPSPVGLMTHLACADELADDSAGAQIDLFTGISASIDLPTSVVNSAGYLRWPQVGDSRARCGIALYGAAPIPSSVDLRAVMTVRTRVLTVQNQLVGTSVGYQYRDQVKNDSILAVIACGYSEGYPFPGQKGTPVLINGNRFPTVGRTSMNMIIADISSARQTIRPGDEVVIWGKGLPVNEIAQANGVISYQLLCAAGSK